jgi:hypothetical protein
MDYGDNWRKYMVNTLTIFIEGGGDKNRQLTNDMILAFTKFFEKSGLKGSMPKIKPCGSRQQTYKQFANAISLGKPAILLIDSESPVDDKYSVGDIHHWDPWGHIRSRTDATGVKCDNWVIIGDNTDCHFMVQMMESWFFADKQNLNMHGFKSANIKDYPDIEQINKPNLIRYLAFSNINSYSKGKNSFALLMTTDPYEVFKRSKWANRLILILREKMAALAGAGSGLLP